MTICLSLQKVLDKILNNSLATLPHSIILTGKKGSGKHTIISHISNYYKLDTIEVTEIISDEVINNIYRIYTPKLYIVDIDKITEKEQNILLKIFEEPPAQTYIILIAETTLNILPTLLSRGYKIKTPEYSIEELKDFASAEGISVEVKYYTSLIKTPGDIIILNKNNIMLIEMEEFIDKILSKFLTASYSNMLNIIDKINFDDDYTKFDFDFFIKLLYYKSCVSYNENNNLLAKTLFDLLNENRKNLSDKRINKKLLFTNILSTLWLGGKDGFKRFEN